MVGVFGGRNFVICSSKYKNPETPLVVDSMTCVRIFSFVIKSRRYAKIINCRFEYENIQKQYENMIFSF